MEIKSEEELVEKAEHDVRHLLAIDRTKMANERTFLAYTRTSLTMLVPALTFLHFAHSKALTIIGIFLIPCGILIFTYGIISFYRKKALIEKEREILNDMLKLQYCNIR